jgi:energy-coupling factor transport system permease protein
MGRKLVSIIMFASSIIASTKVGRLIAAIQEIRFPKGITIGLTVAIRFFPSIAEEGGVIIYPMKRRGLSFSLRGIVTHPVLVIENILVPIIMRMTIVANELSVLSITRGIDSDAKRTSYYKNRFTVADAPLMLLFTAMAVIAVIGVV